MTNTFILGRHLYRVVAPVAVVKLAGGGEKYVYRNAFVPGNADQVHVEKLLELGLIAMIGETK